MAKRSSDNNADEQEQQIEILWEASKILLDEAHWHLHRDNPFDNYDYVVWAGRALAAYDCIRRLINQRVRLLVHSLQSGRAVEVGELEELEADHRDGSVGPYFNSVRRGWLANAAKLNCHVGSGCNYNDAWHRYRVATIVPVKKDTGKP